MPDGEVARLEKQGAGVHVLQVVAVEDIGRDLLIVQFVIALFLQQVHQESGRPVLMLDTVFL
jgi:hypothetical protein